MTRFLISLFLITCMIDCDDDFQEPDTFILTTNRSDSPIAIYISISHGDEYRPPISTSYLHEIAPHSTLENKFYMGDKANSSFIHVFFFPDKSDIDLNRMLEHRIYEAKQLKKDNWTIIYP